MSSIAEPQGLPTSQTPVQSDLPSLGARRLFVFLPAMLFAGLVLVLWWGLRRDPSVLPSTLIGKPVPDFTLPPVQGRALGLSSADLKGEVSLVNVFASWCVACRFEHPFFMRLEAQGAVPIHGMNYKDRPADAAKWLDTMGDPYRRTGADLNGPVGIDWGVVRRAGDFCHRSSGTHRFQAGRTDRPEDPRRDDPSIDRAVAEMKRVGVAVAVLVILTGSGVGYYLYTVRPTDESAATILATSSPSPAKSLLASLDDPRPLPQLQFADGVGVAMSLADFSGKVVLLNVWATWCVPCRKEMPTLDRLQARLGGDDFSVVTLSIDREGAAKVGEFYQEIGGEHLGIYLDSSGWVGRDLNVIGLPTTVLIDSEGRELGRVIGPAEWDSPGIVNTVKRAIDARPTAWNGAGPSPARPIERPFGEFSGTQIDVKRQARRSQVSP